MIVYGKSHQTNKNLNKKKSKNLINNFKLKQKNIIINTNLNNINLKTLTKNDTILIPKISKLYQFRPNLIKFKNKIQSLQKSLTIPNMTYYILKTANFYDNQFQKDFENNFSENFLDENQTKKIILTENKTKTTKIKFGTRYFKKLKTRILLTKLELEGNYTKTKNLDDKLAASKAKIDNSHIFFNRYENQIANANYNKFLGKEYNNKNNYNNINKYLTNLNKTVNFNQNLNNKKYNLETNKIFNLLKYSSIIKIYEFFTTKTTSFFTFLTKKKNNLFITINTNENKLLYKLSIGHLNIKGKEKKVNLTITKLANFFAKFCNNNNFFGSTVILKTNNTRIFKLSNLLNKKKLALNFVKKIKYLHSKPLTQRKKKRL